MSDREHLFSENLLVDSSGAVNVSLPVVAMVSAFMEALRFGWNYELVHQLWPQFTLVAGQVNVDETWSHKELFSASLIPCFKYSSWLFVVVLLLVNFSKRHVTPHPEEGLHLSEDSWLLWPWVWGAARAQLRLHSMPVPDFVGSLCPSWIASAATWVRR